MMNVVFSAEKVPAPLSFASCSTAKFVAVEYHKVGAVSQDLLGQLDESFDLSIPWVTPECWLSTPK